MKPPFAAVTIHLPENEIGDTFQIAKANKNITSFWDDFEFANNKIISHDDHITELSAEDIARLHGPAFATMAKLCAALGKGSTNIRAYDGPNTTPHLDNSTLAIEQFNAKSPQFGLTVTMGINRNGTDLIEIHPDEISRTPSKKYPQIDTTAPQKLIWHWEQKQSLQDRTWQIPPNTIAIMRSKEWPDTHMPCLHKSPYRLEDGNPETGIVGVAFIAGLNLKRLHHHQT